MILHTLNFHQHCKTVDPRLTSKNDVLDSKTKISIILSECEMEILNNQ